MLALLKLVPVKFYLYAGLIVAVLAWFGVHNANERKEGADNALVPVAVLAQKAQIQVAAADATAQTTEASEGKQYAEIISSPPPAPLGIVCHSNASSSDVPEAVGVVATRIGSPAAIGGNGPGYDPSGAALERAAQADAEIKYLQGRIHELETQMVNSP